MKKTFGFTLVEMAIVLVIIGLIMAGLLGTLQSQMDSAKIRETRQTLTDTRDALIAFALSNGRLPCPANPTLANTAATAGQENIILASGLCQRLNGVVPWTTLGTKELDAWGGRFSYSVSDDYTVDPAPYVTSPAPTNAVKDARASRFARRLNVLSDVCSDASQLPSRTTTFGLCSLTLTPPTSPTTAGRINILTSAVGGTSIADNVVAVIVSHGKNRRGSFNPGGGARIAGALGDELANTADTTAGGALAPSFVSKPFVFDPDQLAATYYDDLVEWIPTATLIGKMVNAGKLP